MSVSKEDYLKAIYQLGGNNTKVNNKDIASFLNVSAPSVSEMIKKLLGDGYIEYILYQGVKLTEYGTTEAIKVRRRHLLWEVFLVEKLGYTWDKVDEEAEKLEHLTSLELENRMDKFLNYPKTCPHGTPIIRDENNITTFRTLDSIPLGEEVAILRITDNEKLLKYMDSLGIYIGDKVKVISKSKDLFYLEKEGIKIAIELQEAKKIFA